MKCEVLIDWLTFTVKGEAEPKAIIRKWLGMDPDLFQEAGYGLLGYQKVMSFNDIVVCYEPRENEYFKDMGICVSMSGNGCRTFETMTVFDATGDSPFGTLFEMISTDPNARASRVDVACDDHTGALDMDEIIRKTLNNDINSRMQARQVVSAFNGKDRSGSTVYIGSPSSDFRIRIYDKALEQGQPGHWIRCELVLRGDHSKSFVDCATNYEYIGLLAAQILNDKMSFIERDDSNITRCSVCSWWLDFVQELGSVRLVSRKVVQHSVGHIADWVNYQIGPSLCILLRTLGFDMILDMARNAGDRLSDKQLALIDDFNAARPALGYGGA